LVIDPQNSLQRNQLMIAGFRNYPPSYSVPQTRSLCPDGTVMLDPTLRHELWGQSWSSYYRLELELYTTSLMAHVMEVIQRDSMWSALLSQSKIVDPKFSRLFPPRIDKLIADIAAARTTVVDPSSALVALDDPDILPDRSHAAAASLPAAAAAASTNPKSRSAPASSSGDVQLAKIETASGFIAADFLIAQLSQQCKHQLFR
jgi:hypothetical protein